MNDLILNLPTNVILPVTVGVYGLAVDVAEVAVVLENQPTNVYPVFALAEREAVVP